MAGLVIPHENGFAISIVEKIEDVVVILLLPIVRPSCLFLERLLMYPYVLVFHPLRSED